MLPYLLYWGILASAGLGNARRIAGLTLLALGASLTLLIGLRLEVGADWFNYLFYIERSIGLPFAEVFLESEPGWGLLNWIGANWGGSLFLVNTLSGLVFSIGLLLFCRAQPRPWLALCLAFPYLIVVVAMGYSRQGVAIAVEMLALLALQNNKLLQFLAWIALAATFHRTVLVLLVLPASTLSGSLRFSQLIRFGLLAGAAYGLYSAVIAPNLDYYVQGYLEAEYQSQGALIRVALCLLPAVAFLLNRRGFQLIPDVQRIWTLLSLMAVAAAIGLFTVASSTAVDRLVLYLIPLQLFVGSRVPDTRLFGISPGTWNHLLIFFSLAVLLVWLFFAAHASAWLPYRNLLFDFL
ncbi:putative membrane protein [Synechococcus sp. A15-127]|uniref:EpsG family protein n=1 Tax=Synechococcus sp. A15-127 TaxID=1050624 RepID=UPI0016470719|nr:EpsG family protein [Synechococcus sp. A15-127]QNI95404.1 putative membrane protein [Synechococcus sp. A15-127]